MSLETNVLTVGGRYQAEEVLGQGRLSAVYRAVDLQTGRVVALKVLQAHLRAQAVVVQRFKREMAAVQRLDHEAIIRVFDVVETDEHLALVMEFARGVDLKRWVHANGAMAAERVTKIGGVLLDALGQAHGRGVLHRDLSLANVILDEQNEDRVEIIGFGLARVDELVSLTMHTRVLGTLETMAPEVVLGKSVDARADVFSVGAMLFELVTGEPLHDGRMSSGLAFASDAGYLESVRVRLKAVLKNEAAELLRAIMRALAPDPTLRFATAVQMRDALLGNYDAATWSALENRQSVRCEKCRRPVFERARSCVYCGHAANRLIQNPEGGSYRVEIRRPADFQSQGGQELSARQLQTLYKMLFSYEDTRRVFQGRPADLRPPYVLFDALSQVDAKRVGSLLAQKSIPYAVLHPSKSQPVQATVSTITPSMIQPAASARTHADKRTTLVEMVGYGIVALVPTLYVMSISLRPILNLLPPMPLYGRVLAVLLLFLATITIVSVAIWAFVELSWANAFAFLRARIPFWGKSGWKIPLGLLAFTAFLALFFWLPFQPAIRGGVWAVPVVAGFLAFVAGGLVAWRAQKHLNKLGLNADAPAKTAARIPGAVLARGRQPGEHGIEDVLPRKTLDMLRKLKIPALQQEFHDILALAARLFADSRVPPQALKQALEPMFHHTGTLISELVELAKNTPKSNAETILNALSGLDAKLAKTTKTSDIEKLLSQRNARLEELDRLDRIAQQTYLARGQLLEVRATVLDFQSQFNSAALPSIERVQEEISELQIRFEAEREVRQLLENA